MDDTMTADRSAAEAATSNPAPGEERHGKAIAVLERGFVFVGDVTTDHRWVRIAGGRSLIRWGTSKHLAQLANDGPQANTRLGDASDVKAPIGSLIAILPVDAAKWNG